MDRDDQRCSISNMCHNESIEVVKNRGLDLRQRLKQPSVDLCHPSFPPLPLIAVWYYLLGSATSGGGASTISATSATSVDNACY